MSSAAIADNDCLYHFKPPSAAKLCIRCSSKPLVQPMLHADRRISELGGLLQHREQVLAIVESEADEIAAKFGSPRCTVMSAEANSSMSVEDIIPNSHSLVVFSRKGYIKRIPADTFAVQHRGGRGVIPRLLIPSHPLRCGDELDKPIAPPHPPFCPRPPHPAAYTVLQWLMSSCCAHQPTCSLSCFACLLLWNLTLRRPGQALYVALQYSTSLLLVQGHHYCRQPYSVML